VFEIKLKVNGNGTISTGTAGRLRLGTADEISRAKLVFDVDTSIEGPYHYIKFVNKSFSILYRVTNKEFVLTKTILAIPGVWLFSFISSNGTIENDVVNGSYLYISEPVEAVVVEGILTKVGLSEDALMVKKLFGMDIEGDLVIPDYVDEIGDYFMYNSHKEFSVYIGQGVKSIGSYAFYDSLIPVVWFDENSQLQTLRDYAFYNIFFEESVYIPASVTSWGKYCFSKSDISCIFFRPNSKLETIGSHAFWEVRCAEIYLPDHLKTFGGNTYAIKDCDVEYIWIPNTITSNIPQSAIYGCDNLTRIELQEGFNVSCNFSNCTNLSQRAIVYMLLALKDLTGQPAKSITLGENNLAKLTDTEIEIAINKNWTIS